MLFHRHLLKLLSCFACAVFLAGTASADLLRYDGVYCTARDSHGFIDYLRFYSDGRFVSAISEGSPKQVAQWLRRGVFLPEGRYFVSGNRLEFTDAVGTWSAGNSGDILPESLIFHSQPRDYYNGDRRFAFVRVQFKR